jgi:phosphate starvation-inducible PhoH-like protein
VFFDSVGDVLTVFGVYDEFAKYIEQELNVLLSTRDNNIEIRGENDACQVAHAVIQELLRRAKKEENIDISLIKYIIQMELNGEKADDSAGDNVIVTFRGKQIKCKSRGQRRYVDAIRNNTIDFGVGPAGTGKTYLAVAMAVNALKNKQVSRIILTRPAVEAGEKLGFLPGDLQEKVDPYLRPLYDALHDMLGFENYQRMLEKGVIEIAPLAYMRGRTLNEAFIILDEAQNTTREQMKMFLTRIGAGSKAIVNGDLTQVDLPDGKKSGLKQAVQILTDIDGIAVANFTGKDIVRHELIEKIVQAYEAKGKEGD